MSKACFTEPPRRGTANEMITEDDERDALELRSFGRTHGRTLSARQAGLVRDLLPRLAVELATPADLPQPPFKDLWLEIGFGGGEHLLWQAAHRPDVQIIGCEPFVDGMVKALSGIETDAIANVRLHADDARPLLRWLTPASLGRCFVLFPDPWPKRRHVKRRLISPTTLALIARALRPGAELRIATDIGDYARTTLLAVAATPQLRWTATCAADWRERPSDWPPTRYEAKAIREGRPRYFLRFVRT